jgi:hypothetical protein
MEFCWQSNWTFKIYYALSTGVNGTQVQDVTISVLIADTQNIDVTQKRQNQYELCRF